MSIWRGGPFYENDDVTLKGEFESDGEAQTPDAGSAKCTIYKKGTATAVVADAIASISGTIISYKFADATYGDYVAYLTAKFNQGADERTGEIIFSVKRKTGVW